MNVGRARTLGRMMGRLAWALFEYIYESEKATGKAKAAKAFHDEFRREFPYKLDEGQK